MRSQQLASWLTHETAVGRRLAIDLPRPARTPGVASLEEEINHLRRYGFWVSETLVHQVLEEAGEVNG